MSPFLFLSFLSFFLPLLGSSLCLLAKHPDHTLESEPRRDIVARPEHLSELGSTQGFEGESLFLSIVRCGVVLLLGVPVSVDQLIS